METSDILGFIAPRCPRVGIGGAFLVRPEDSSEVSTRLHLPVDIRVATMNVETLSEHATFSDDTKGERS